MLRERERRQRGEVSGGTEIAAAHFHHLYLSGCRASNYCCHIAHNEGKHDACADVFEYMIRLCIYSCTGYHPPRFVFFFFFFLCCLYETVSSPWSRHVSAPYFFMRSRRPARVCKRVRVCVRGDYTSPVNHLERGSLVREA